MKASFQVLSEEERHRVHDESLKVLEHTGVKVETREGRRILKLAGVSVDENTSIVKFPRSLVESSLKQVTRDFVLSARRPGADLVMNSGESTLCPDGGGTMVLDCKTGERRAATYDDWQDVTRLADAIDEVGVYWCPVHPAARTATSGSRIDYACRVFRNFSKHIQDTPSYAEQVPLFTEILQVIFGTKEDIRKNHPVSGLLCPQSPLMIDKAYTEGYLALKGWNVPVAIMPMPLMGATSPGNMISTIVQGNCEVLATICLVQANEPGVPIIYAPALAVMNPRTAMLSDASMEYTIMDSAATEMARHYGIPAESSPGGSDAHVPNVQHFLESASMGMPTMLSWPDIVVGPGMLDGSTVSCLEKFVIDVELFRLAKHAHRGVNTSKDNWLTDVISSVGPGGNYLCEQSTASAVRSDDWYVTDFGSHDTYDNWVASGKKDVVEEASDKVQSILTAHEPLPLGDDAEKELAKICKRASQM